MEYSNLGYAILGRIITNVAGGPYADEISRTLLKPLKMTSSSFHADAEGEFTWRGATGRLAGSILLTPTEPPRIQSLTLTPK